MMPVRAQGLRIAGGVAALAFGFVVSTFAQQASPSPRRQENEHKFVSTTELVLVPVVVHDKSEAHVSGLSKNDFQLFEAGKPQNIAVFEEVKATTSPANRTPAESGVYTNKLEQDRSTKRIVVIALDEINSPYLDQARARQQLIQHLVEAIGDGALTALVRIDGRGITVIHDFASDSRILVAGLRAVLAAEGGKVSPTELDKLAVPPPSEGVAGPRDYNSPNLTAAVDSGKALKSFFEELARPAKQAAQGAAIEDTLEALEHIAHALAGIPGRKSLIWVTGSFSAALDPFSPILQGRGQTYLRRTLQAVNDANIAVYPVDIRGLVTLDMGGIEEDISGRSLRAQFGNPVATPDDPAQLRLEAMRSFAASTGGLPFYNNNQVVEGIRRAIEDSSSYYLLGYYRSEKTSGMQWRPLTVKLDKAGVHVRSRSGFYAGKADEKIYTAELINALNSPWDYTGVPISMRWTGAPASDGKEKKQVNFEISLPAASIGLADHHVQLQYAAAVRELDGKLVTRWGQVVNGAVTPDEEQHIITSGVTYRNALLVPQGKYLVRFVVRDDVTGHIGSVLAPLDVN
jgi:VWFA-related protein